MKIALGIEYDGSQFCGWQIQPSLRTVQGVLENSLSKIAAHPVNVTCAGRTDTGVHATNQVVHFETDASRPLKSWIYGSNSNLAKDVVIKWVKEVPEGFDARFSAISRRYRYIIFNHSVRAAHLRSWVTWHYHDLNVELMHQESQLLLGEHDFSAFRSSQCQAKVPVRTIKHISVRSEGALIIVDVEANAFLHHMVRNIVGVLINVGTQREQSGWAKELLDGKDRTKGADTAPPYGLYLLDVIYPEKFTIPATASQPLYINKSFGQ